MKHADREENDTLHAISSGSMPGNGPVLVPELVLRHAEQMEQAQEHVRRALLVIREYQMSIAPKVPSRPPARTITGTFSCAWRWELPMLLPL